MSAIEIIAAVVTLVSIAFATRENVWYYPTGIVSMLLSAWVYFEQRLYAECALQFVWLALMIYGWYEWVRGGEGKSELPVTRTPLVAWIAIVLAGIAATAAIVWLQRSFTNNPAPFVDSSIAAWSIVAQWMTAEKWIENWLFWIVINVLAVGLYVHREMWAFALLYVGLFILGIEGFRKWRRSLASA